MMRRTVFGASAPASRLAKSCTSFGVMAEMRDGPNAGRTWRRKIDS
jgi:hypothetical protein